MWLYNNDSISYFLKDPGVENGNCSDGNVRVENGSGLLGRLEICINNLWGTVCETQFGLSELQVACLQLGGTGSGHIA